MKLLHTNEKSKWLYETDGRLIAVFKEGMGYTANVMVNKANSQWVTVTALTRKRLLNKIRRIKL